VTDRGGTPYLDYEGLDVALGVVDVTEAAGGRSLLARIAVMLTKMTR
jgi:hypothetical protein